MHASRKVNEGTKTLRTITLETFADAVRWLHGHCIIPVTENTKPYSTALSCGQEVEIYPKGERRVGTYYRMARVENTVINSN